MVGTFMSKQSINKKKFKMLKKKRSDLRNKKKVHELAHGNTAVLRKHRPSKKKQQKDTKRKRIYVEAEKAKLLKSGLITQEDIDKLEEEDAEQQSDDGEESMEMEN